MTSTYEVDNNALFGPETDDEDEQNKMDHEIDDPGDDDEDGRDDTSVLEERARPSKRPRSELNKNKILKKMIESAKKTSDAMRAMDRSGQISWSEKEAPLSPRKEVKQKKFINNRIDHCTEAILVHDDDLEKREKASDTCKIQRDICVKQTRFYPFFTGSAANTQEFYTKRTDLMCMWCTEPFGTIPIPRPYSYSRSKQAFYVGGQFCSFQCMLADAVRCRRKPLACHMMKSVYKVPFAEIGEMSPAPNPLLLEKFGGVMTIKAFRGTSLTKGVKTRSIRLPFMPLSAGIEEVQRMTTTIYEYGNEEKVRKVVNASIVMSQPIPLTLARGNSNMQRTKLAQMPTLQQQIAQAENTLRLERSSETKKKASKKKTLRDFMKIK